MTIILLKLIMCLNIHILYISKTTTQIFLCYFIKAIPQKKASAFACAYGFNFSKWMPSTSVLLPNVPNYILLGRTKLTYSPTSSIRCCILESSTCIAKTKHTIINISSTQFIRAHKKSGMRMKIHHTHTHTYCTHMSIYSEPNFGKGPNANSHLSHTWLERNWIVFATTIRSRHINVLEKKTPNARFWMGVSETQINNIYTSM